MIEFRQVDKAYGAQQVLRDASFRVHSGERLGIVGPNGAGKSTLFQLIVGEITPDHGSVLVPSSLRIGHLRQELQPPDRETRLLAYAEDALPALQKLEERIHAIERGLAAARDPERAALLRELGGLQTTFEHEGGYEIGRRAQAALGGLGFDTADFERPFRDFSGGWRMRAELARVLAAAPDVLLLDEPSNYLDLPAVEWLQRFLRDFAGTLLLISHDRYLLNSLCTTTLEVAGARVERYAGNYAHYDAERALRQEQREAARKNLDRRREQVERFVERFRAKASKASQVQSRVKMLERMETPDALPPARYRRGTLRLAPPPRAAAEVMRLEDAGLSYDGAHWVLRHVDLAIVRGEKIALVGRNGLGKTTLLRMLAGAVPLSEGRRRVGLHVVVGHQSQDFADTMDPGRTVYETVKGVAPDVMEREVRTLLGGFGFSGEAVGKRVGVLSGGEKVRLAFARLLIRPPNFLLLDEPTTHLDIGACEALEDALRHYTGTLCLVSHDVAFVRRVATGVIALTPPGITRYAGGYDDYREKTAGTGTAPAASAGVGESDRKRARRERAERVQARSRERRRHQRDAERAERRIAELEAEQRQLADAWSLDTASVDPAAAARRLYEVQIELEEQIARWEEASTALEEGGGNPAACRT